MEILSKEAYLALKPEEQKAYDAQMELQSANISSAGTNGLSTDAAIAAAKAGTALPIEVIAFESTEIGKSHLATISVVINGKPNKVYGGDCATIMSIVESAELRWARANSIAMAIKGEAVKTEVPSTPVALVFSGAFKKNAKNKDVAILASAKIPVPTK